MPLTIFIFYMSCKSLQVFMKKELFRILSLLTKRLCLSLKIYYFFMVSKSSSVVHTRDYIILYYVKMIYNNFDHVWRNYKITELLFYDKIVIYGVNMSLAKMLGQGPSWMDIMVVQFTIPHQIVRIEGGSEGSMKY